jgi:hypothetical protein
MSEVYYGYVYTDKKSIGQKWNGVYDTIESPFGTVMYFAIEE